MRKTIHPLSLPVPALVCGAASDILIFLSCTCIQRGMEWNVLLSTSLLCSHIHSKRQQRVTSCSLCCARVCVVTAAEENQNKRALHVRCCVLCTSMNMLRAHSFMMNGCCRRGRGLYSTPTLLASSPRWCEILGMFIARLESTNRIYPTYL